MKKSLVAITAAFVTLALTGAHRPRATQTPARPSQGEALTVRNPFDADLTYRTAAGEIRRVHVARRQWSLVGQSILPRSPEAGLLVVQLTGGDIKITSGKNEQTPRGDEFLTVPAGAPLRIEVGKEQATLEVLAVTER